jgi:hypothetical protein
LDLIFAFLEFDFVDLESNIGTFRTRFFPLETQKVGNDRSSRCFLVGLPVNIEGLWNSNHSFNGYYVSNFVGRAFNMGQSNDFDVGYERMNAL